MSDNEQDSFANEICPLNYEPHYIFNQSSFSHFGGFFKNLFEEDNYYQLSFSDDTQSVNDTSQNLKKAIENIFPFNNNKEKDDTINIQNTHQNKKEEPLNASELPAIEEFKQIKEREEKSEIFQDYENYDSEKKNNEKEESIKEEEPKSKTANQIKFQELSKEEQNLCINKKRKRKVSTKFVKRRKNVNSNNESKKEEIFITRKINTSEGLKFIVGQYIYDKRKEETKNENTKSFWNKKFKDVLKPYINKRSLDKMKKKLKKDYEFSTTSKFIKKLLNKKEGKNKKRKLTKPQIKQIFRIFNSIKTPKKVKKKRKKINGSNENITMINHGSLKNSILKFDDKSVNNNLLDDNSNKISSFKIDILRNSEKNKKLFPININDGNTTNGESNIRSNKQGKSEDKRDGIEIRNDHLNNRIKNIIWDVFFEIFNLVNKSYKLKKIKEEDDNDDEEEEEEEEEKEEKSENEEVLVGILNEIEELEKNAKEIKENEQGDIILYISKENNNNNTKKDFKFMKTSFEKIIDMAKKRQHLEGLEESEKAKKLIKIKKNVFLKTILANTKLSKKIFDKIQKEKENQWKNDICRNIKNEIAKRKDLDGLVNILYTKEKDSFITEIKKLGGYEKMIPSCEDINNNIQIYMKLLKETADNMFDNLEKKYEIIKEKEKEKEKKLKK